MQSIKKDYTCILHNFLGTRSHYWRGDHMNKKEQEKLQQKKSLERFNSITQKVTPENQNQTHNSRREGMGPNTKRKSD